MEKDTKNRACFTGHRPEKLLRRKEEIVGELEREIDRTINEGITEFITGMVRGVDLWAAEIILDKKRKNCNIRLICAVPYKDFSKKWASQWRELYDEILVNSDMVHVLNEKFSYASFMQRNRWMVDNSDVVIAVFNGNTGGTEKTLKYAEKSNKDIRIIEA